MHLIYDTEIMQDKADAIREILGLPDTPENKMTPPQMADKLLSIANDPTLLIALNDYPMIDYLNFGITIPLFNNHITDLDFNKYTKVRADFKISDLSYTYDRSFSMEDLWSLRDNANYPGVKLLSVTPVFGSPIPSGQARDSYVFNHSLIQIYKSSSEGIVLVFGKEGRQNLNTVWTYHGVFPNRKLDHIENKKISIIFSKNVINEYYVLVDDEYAFSDELCHTDQTDMEPGDYSTAVWPPRDPINSISIGNTGNSPFYPNSQYEMAFQNYGIKFDSLSIKYAE